MILCPQEREPEDQWRRGNGTRKAVENSQTLVSSGSPFTEGRHRKVDHTRNAFLQCILGSTTSFEKKNAPLRGYGSSKVKTLFMDSLH